MTDKDDVKQNAGAHQGNIHQDSNEGRNDDGHPGSTLEKTPATNPHEEKEGSETDSDKAKSSGNRETREGETEGTP